LINIFDIAFFDHLSKSIKAAFLVIPKSDPTTILHDVQLDLGVQVRERGQLVRYALAHHISSAVVIALDRKPLAFPMPVAVCGNTRNSLLIVSSLKVVLNLWIAALTWSIPKSNYLVPAIENRSTIFAIVCLTA